MNVLNHFFTEQVVCVIGQNTMAYIERAVDYLKELPEDDSNLLYLLNQSLIAMQEAVWGHGVKVKKIARKKFYTSETGQENIWARPEAMDRRPIDGLAEAIYHKRNGEGRG